MGNSVRHLVGVVGAWAWLWSCAAEPPPPAPTENVFRTANPNADLPVSYDFRFAWPEGLMGTFDGMSTVRLTQPGFAAEGLRAPFSGFVDVQAAESGGRTVVWRDVRFTRPSPLEGGVGQRMNQLVVASLVATFSTAGWTETVSNKGAYVSQSAEATRAAVVGVAGRSARSMAKGLAKRRSDVRADLSALAEQMVDRALAPEARDVASKERWRDLVGIWTTSGAWTLGQTRRFHTNAPVPLQGGEAVPTEVMASLVSRVPCPDRATETCVLLRVRRTPDARRAADVFSDHVANLDGRGDAGRVRRYEASVVREIVAIPETLVPLTETVTVNADMLIDYGRSRASLTEEQTVKVVYRWTNAHGGTVEAIEVAEGPSKER